MKQEFITTRGRVEIQNGSIFIKNLKPDIESSIFGKLIIPFIVLLLCIYRLVDAEKPLDYVVGIFWGIAFLGYGNRLFDIIIKRSIANRIPLQRIHTAEVKADDTGLEAHVLLYLRNGRYRLIPFRTLEQQYEPFTELISQYIAQPQLS